MDREIKKIAIKQYFKYFIIWFVVAALLMLLLFGKIVIKSVEFVVDKVTDTIVTVEENTLADPERVFDFADVLTDTEEDLLREQIRSQEEKTKIHIVLVTSSEDMESGPKTWERAMRDYADDFYDERYYGFDKPRGTGVLLLDNWYPGQEGSWLSTCGKVEDCFRDYEINRVLDAVYNNISSPYNAYSMYIRTTARIYEQRSKKTPAIVVAMPWLLGGFVGIVIISIIYMCANLKKPQNADTTNAYTYMTLKPLVKNKQDDFIRKNVTTVRIQTSSSSSGSHHSGGHHTSSHGVSHGGGGRRR